MIQENLTNSTSNTTPAIHPIQNHLEKHEFKNIYINTDVFCILEKIGAESLSNSLRSAKLSKQGLIFGCESEKKIDISNLYSLSTLNWDETTKDEISTIRNHLENSRMDFSPLGIYVITENFSVNPDILKVLLKMEVLNPQSVFLHYNPVTRKTLLKRLSHRVIEYNFQAEIRNYHEYVIDLFNKQYTCDIFEDAQYSVVQDVHSMLSSINSGVVAEKKNKFDSAFEKNTDKAISSKLTELNKLCGKIIEEQGKYLTFYKTKKVMGNEKKKELDELTQKKIGDFANFEKMEMGIVIQNMKTELSQLKELISE
mmetsp:Transcript_34104/g.35402  ORF Transcript_34104/g.35402 Transcript_34104/m.35402 type:complete len:312 (+) Transcript_34104:3-938(+)